MCERKNYVISHGSSSVMIPTLVRPMESFSSISIPTIVPVANPAPICNITDYIGEVINHLACRCKPDKPFEKPDYGRTIFDPFRHEDDTDSIEINVADACTEDKDRQHHETKHW